MDELDQINQQIAELQKKAKEIQQQKKAGVIAEVKAMIAAHGLTAAECGFSASGKGEARKPRPAIIKYRHGAQTWSGRGKTPRWVESYLANGGKLEDLAV